MYAIRINVKSRANPTLTLSDDPRKSSSVNKKGTIVIEIDTPTMISKKVLCIKVSVDAHTAPA